MATLQEYYNQLAPIYEPQIASLKAQEASLAPQYQAQKSALEQARINAFRNISNTASARGMAFSGFTPEQEAQYTGTTYLPAMANLETQQLKSKQSLIDAINAANSERYAKAMGLSESAQQAEAKLAEEQRQFEQQQAMEAYKAQLSASTKSPKAPTTNELLQSLMEDAQGFFHGRNFNPNGNLQDQTTEKKIIPELQRLYPELSLKQIKEKVYGIRKQMYGV
jgi:predicted NAD-dependent protein-ADP-ribosyltransferase YbiA (DUF1768 family)